MTINLEELEKSILDLGYCYPKEIIQVYAHKELKINAVVDYIKMNFLSSINKDAYDYLKIEAMIEYIIITTIGLTDIFANIMYQLFDLKLKKREKIYFNDSLCNKLLKETNNLEKEIADKIKSILESESYIYFKDLCNYIKHNNIIDTSISIKHNREVGTNIDIIIKEFSHDNKKYSCKNFNELLNDYIKISNNLIGIFQFFIDYTQ